MMEKTREQLKEEILREFRENEERKQEALQKLDSEVSGRTIIDWNDGREKLLANGVSVQKTFGEEEWVLERQEKCLVRNFPRIVVKNAHLIDCMFENCDTVKLEEGTAVRCVFSKDRTIWLDDMKVYDCEFRDLHTSEKGSIIDMEDSTVSGCHFCDIRVEDDNYLIDGIGDCTVEKCDFERVRSRRGDGALFFCQEFVGKLFRRLREYDMVDRDSCSGLDDEA